MYRQDLEKIPIIKKINEGTKSQKKWNTMFVITPKINKPVGYFLLFINKHSFHLNIINKTLFVVLIITKIGRENNISAVFFLK